MWLLWTRDGAAEDASGEQNPLFSKAAPRSYVCSSRRLRDVPSHDAPGAVLHSSQ